MDELKPEDELKPDTSDRRPPRSRKTSSMPKVPPVSRQHMMMGVGILVLLLLVLGIGSALKSPESGSDKPSQAPSAGSNGEKNIDLSGGSSISGQGNASESAASGEQNSAPRELSAPQIASTPTEAQPIDPPQNQQRVDLPGDLNNALSNQQGQVDMASESGRNASSLPTGQATVGGTGSRPAAKSSAPQQNQTTVQQSKPATTHKQATKAPAARENRSTSHNAASSHSGTAGRSSTSGAAKPGGNYTLQLSSASRSDTLNAWAKKQNLSGYHVYQTTRNGQPWYVLVSGSYTTPAEAKRAVATLPADVRAQNPWVKPVSQVKKESGK